MYRITTNEQARIDRLDAALIELLAGEPRVGVLEGSRRLGVARGTVQARLDRLADRGVITGYGPEVDPAALGSGRPGPPTVSSPSPASRRA
jgi:DNA-binding Lrp family transcriptional regulator